MELFFDIFFERPVAPIANLPIACVFNNPELDRLWAHLIVQAPCLARSCYIDSIKTASPESLPALLRSIDILSAQSNKFITLDNINLLIEAKEHAPSLARGLQNLSEAADSKQASYMIPRLRSLLLQSTAHASSVGESLASNLNCCGLGVIEAFGLENFASLLESIAPEHRHSLIVGLTYLFLSRSYNFLEKAILLASIAPLALNAGFFWSELMIYHPMQATDKMFLIMIKNAKNLKKALPFIYSDQIHYFIRLGYLAQIIEQPALGSYFIEILSPSDKELQQQLLSCLQAHWDNTESLLEIMLILYGSGALTRHTAGFLFHTRAEDLSCLLEAVRGLSYWTTEKSFSQIWAATDKQHCSQILRAQAETTFLNLSEDARLELILNKVSTLNQSGELILHLQEIARTLVNSCESSAQHTMFLSFMTVLHKPGMTISEKIATLENKISAMQALREQSSPTSCAHSPEILSFRKQIIADISAKRKNTP